MASGLYEKEILAVALIDTLYDIESRGVSPSNLNALTVLLTLDGLKVSARVYTKSIGTFLSCIRRAEERPDLSSMDDENLLSVFRDIVRHAMGMQTVAQLRQEMWEELQGIRERGVDRSHLSLWVKVRLPWNLLIIHTKPPGILQRDLTFETQMSLSHKIQYSDTLDTPGI
ncbi:uncharacterized protein ARMOST_04447 [Armillaria ostoyae]|uniref:Uncharacterized protein n=1 Tax=Armillaria ostoyae TaxID=47428 RepID=A0A284QXE5_ARMOS|nr:uncharacterized protein ARMOST_04447 [Armillaria ostoyae]